MYAAGHYDLTLVTPPVGTPVTLAQAKAHLRIENGDDDVLISMLCDAATAYFDPGGRGWLGIALMSQQWDMTSGWFPGQYGSGDPELWKFTRPWGAFPLIELPYPPLISVDAVTYYDASGILQTFSPSAYQVAGVGSRSKGRVSLVPGGFWPSTQWGRAGAVKVRFTCGHATAAAVPATIRQAILLTIGHLYENREAVASTGIALQEIPIGIDMLLAPMRIHL